MAVWKMGTAKFYPYRSRDLRTTCKVFDEITNDLLEPMVIGIDRCPIIGWHFNLIYSSNNIKKLYYKTCKQNKFKDKRIFLHSDDLIPLIYKDEHDFNLDIKTPDYKQSIYFIQYIEKRQREEMVRQQMYKLTALLSKYIMTDIIGIGGDLGCAKNEMGRVISPSFFKKNGGNDTRPPNTLSPISF